MRFNFPYCRRFRRFVFAAGLAVALSQLCAAQPQSPDDKSGPAKAAAPPPEQVSHVVENSVVKVFSTVRHPDYYRPWTKQAPAEMTASGVVIEGKRILSNAHVVLYASQVQVQANQAGDKVSATVVAVAPGIDLAVLKLDDETFFDTHPPLPRASTLPEIKDIVMAYGYPKGGTSLSITKGIVSRIEFAPYNLGVSGLRIQIDAAINPGNSGGPAVVGDKMIGLAFSHLASSESIGYIIPCEEIDLFLEDIADGHYDGKPAFVDDLQTLQNPALRSFLKLDKSAQGAVVHKPDSDDPAYPLKQWDVITRIGTTPVDDEGMIKLNSNLRVMFSYMVQKLAAHGKLPLTVIRAGNEVSLELPVQAKHPMVIPSLEGAYPSYFVYGPLVFSTATQEFVGGFTSGNRQWAQYLTEAGSALMTRLGDKPAFEGEGLVVVSSPFFPHKLSKGYSSPLGQVVKTVNGLPIKNLNHLVEVLRDSKDEFIRFEFDQRRAETLVFQRAQVMAAMDDILSDNDLRSQGSPDTMAIWNQAKTSK
jgi:S1-C subfamily serine protease